MRKTIWNLYLLCSELSYLRSPSPRTLWPGFRWAPPPSRSPAPSRWTAGSHHWRPPTQWRWSPRWPAAGRRCSKKITLKLLSSIFSWHWHWDASKFDGKIFRPSHLNSNCQVVLLDSLKIQRLVNLHISVGPAILLSLLQIERVVFVCLVRGAANELIKYGRIVLDTRARKEVGQNMFFTLQKGYKITKLLVLSVLAGTLHWFCGTLIPWFKRNYSKNKHIIHT